MQGNDTFRIYGESPYNVVILHGGPGAPGGVAPIARELALHYGVLEPFQTQKSINGQIEELCDFIQNGADIPVILIGHSWGAWLAFIFTSKYPHLVQKLILVAAGAFEEKYNADILNLRMNHLSDTDRAEVKKLLHLLGNPDNKNDREIFKRFGQLMSKADTYCPIFDESEVIEFQPEIFNAVWKEASDMRKTGILIQLGEKIKCNTIAIHGNYDPHPSSGVQKSLSKVLVNFKFFELAKCGHYPWNEKYARDDFFRILNEELTG